MVAPLVPSAFVYRIDRPGRFVPNHELPAALWVPVPVLVDPARHYAVSDRAAVVPGNRRGDPDRHVVWGLTCCLVEDLFARVGWSQLD
jgi:hypothetical protein